MSVDRLRFVYRAAWVWVFFLGESAGAAEFRSGELTLRFSDQTGQWTGLRLENPAIELLAGSAGSVAAATLRVDGKEMPSADLTGQVTFDQRHGATDEIIVTIRYPAWSVRCTYQIDGARRRIVRRVAWTYHGTKPAEVSNAILRVPSLRLDGDPAAFFLLPAPWPATEIPLARLSPGRCTSESGWLTGQSGILIAHTPRAKVSVLVGHELLLDGAVAGIEERTGAADLCHYLNTMGLIQPGQTWEVGSQHIQVAAGPWSNGLRLLSKFSATLGNGPPSDSPAWLDRCVIYSCYPRGPIEVSFNAGGDFRSYAKELDRLAALGVNTIWLNPIYTEPPGIYTITDHRALATALGTPEDFKAYVDRAHTLGLRVWLDLVSHGPAKDSPDARQAPLEAFARNRDGTPCMSWGSLTGDYAHPAWQKYMSDVAAYWVQRFGVDGFRHDCGGGSSGLNWSPTAPYRPSAHAPFGGVMLTRAVRNRIRTVKPDAAIFSETGGPVFFRSADLLYDYAFYLACRELTCGTTVEEWIPKMRRWLGLSEATCPGWGPRRLVRCVENHDTVRSAEFFGAGPAQALMALAIFTRGTPMVYQDQEKGCTRLLSQWLRLRNTLPELHAGSADYTTVEASDPGVFAFLRQTDTRASVVAVNLTGRRVETQLRWPDDLAARLPVAHRVETGQVIAGNGSRSTIAIDPYRAAIVALRASRDDTLCSGATSQAVVEAPPLEDTLLEATTQPVGVGQGLDVDPFYVTVTNTHYRLQLARRHGGTIASLSIGDKRLGSSGTAAIASELYSDWGLYPKGHYAGTREEPRPRLSVQRRQAGAEVTFRGRLMGSSWNSIQRGFPCRPPCDYRLTYGLNASPAVQMTIGLTSRTDRPATQAFYAFCWRIPGVTSWSAITPKGTVRGRPNDRPGQRVFESAGLGPEIRTWSLTLSTVAGLLTVRLPDGATTHPQNVFLLDTKGDEMVLFIAMLNGGAVDLKAGRENVVTVEWLFEAAPSK